MGHRENFTSFSGGEGAPVKMEHKKYIDSLSGRGNTPEFKKALEMARKIKENGVGPHPPERFYTTWGHIVSQVLEMVGQILEHEKGRTLNQEEIIRSYNDIMNLFGITRDSFADKPDLTQFETAIGKLDENPEIAIGKIGSSIAETKAELLKLVVVTPEDVKNLRLDYIGPRFRVSMYNSKPRELD